MTLRTACFKCIVKNVPNRMQFFRLGLPRSLQDKLEHYFDSNRKTMFSDALPTRECFSSVRAYEIYEEVMDNYMSDWDWSNAAPLPPDLYAYFMTLTPEDEFWLFSTTHVITYRCVTPFGYSVCSSCCGECTINYSVHTFFRETELFTFCQDINNWCANCILTPLFEVQKDVM